MTNNFLRPAGDKTFAAATKCPTKSESSTVEPEVLSSTGSRRRHLVACIYVSLCAVHGGPLLFTVFFAAVCAVVQDDVRLAAITLDSIRVLRICCLLLNPI